MKQKIQILALLISFCFTFQTQGQNKSAEDTLASITEADELKLLKADELFDLSNYVGAMSLFDTLSVHYPQSVMFKLKTGICYLHASSKHDKALTYLLDVKNKKPDLENIDYYLGRAYLYNYMYDEAISSFTKYQSIPAKKKEKKFDVSHFIDYCNNGKVLLREPINTYIDNIGKPINTDNSEYVPVISSDESFMIYTYRGERSKGGKQDSHNRSNTEGEYYEDIFISYRIGDHWLYPEPIESINTKYDDAAIALSVDGQKLFVFKATSKDQGDIYISQLNGSDWSTPLKLNSNINTNFWEGSITMTSDEKMIYFTSARPGGYGGRDIYRSKKQANGDWGPAENLGPKINTKYNEDAPFIHPNSKLLYFSSEGHNSIGGYDVFKSNVVGDSLSEPENMGFPVNTSSDDKYISITSNGARAYYSSGVDEGLGQQDIYKITPGVPGKKPQIAIVKGVVTANENAVKAEIHVTSKDGSKNYGTFYSNAESGKYLLVLLPSVNYKISFQATGFNAHNEYVNTSSLRKAVDVVEDIHLYSADYTRPRKLSRDTIGFIFSRLEEEISKLDSMDFNDDKLIALAREREEERAMNLPLNSNSFRVSTEATIKRILAQNSITRIETKQVVENSLKNSEQQLAQSIQETKPSLDSTAKLATQTENKGNAFNAENTQTLEGATPEKVQADNPNSTDKSNKTSTVFGVYYKVQIGAYIHPLNFKYPQIKSLGNVETLKLEDGITRFTIGNFETLLEAEILRKTIIEKGIKDAWITATVNGERKLLIELKKMNLKVIN